MNQLEAMSPHRLAEMPHPDPPREDRPFLGHGTEVGTVAAARRRWPLIAMIVVGSTALTYAGGWMVTPRYSAEVRLMIDLKEPSRGALPTDRRAMPPTEETVRKNEMAIIQSRSLAEAVVARLRLDREPEFNAALRPPSALRTLVGRMAGALAGFLPGIGEAGGGAAALSEAQRHAAIVDAFGRRLDVVPSDASRVIGIRFQSEDPGRATTVANTVADRYIARKRAEELEAAQAMAATLEEHIGRLNREVRDAELDTVRARNGRNAPSGTDARFAAERLAALSRELGEATAGRLRAESRLEELRLADAGGDTAAEVVDSPLVQRLQAEAALVSARIGQMSATHGDSHPRLVEARNELRALRDRIGEEIATIRNALTSALVRARANEDLLRQEGDRLKKAVAEADRSDVGLRMLEREAEARRSLRSELVSRLNGTKAQIRLLELQGPAARVISEAVEPLEPSHPPKRAMVMVAFLLSTVGGVILSVLLERRDGSVRCTDQIRALTSARVLGGLPVLRGRERGVRAAGSRASLNRKSEFSEKLRGIWLQVSQSGHGPARTILVTSPMPGEGKSTVAVSLARMLALSGRKALILDADLRRPCVHRAFGGTLAPGLSELVGRGLDPLDVLQHDRASGACFISAGASAASPADILQMPGLQSTLRTLSLAFDAVIIDSPPVLAVHDACLLARRVDRTILVVRWQATRVTSLNAALQCLSDQDILVDGIVLSMVNGKKYGLYGSQDSEIFSRRFKEYYES